MFTLHTGDIAENVARKDTRPSLAKKLHVLSALEIERYRKRTTDLSSVTSIHLFF